MGQLPTLEHNQKKVTVGVGEQGQSLFFFVVFSLNVNRPPDVEHRIDDIDGQSRQRDENRQFHEHHLPLPESAGKCYFKKLPFPAQARFIPKNVADRARVGSMTTCICSTVPLPLRSAAIIEYHTVR